MLAYKMQNIFWDKNSKYFSLDVYHIRTSVKMSRVSLTRKINHVYFCWYQVFISEVKQQTYNKHYSVCINVLTCSAWITSSQLEAACNIKLWKVCCLHRRKEVITGDRNKNILQVHTEIRNIKQCALHEFGKLGKTGREPTYMH